MAGMGVTAATMANQLLSRTTPISAKIQTIGSRTRPTLFRGVARPHAPSGLNLLHLLPRIPRMKTSPRLGAATESRMQSRRWFRAREPKSLVAAAPRKSPRAGKTQHQHHLHHRLTRLHRHHQLHHHQLHHHQLLPHPNSSLTRTTTPRDSRESS